MNKLLICCTLNFKEIIYYEVRVCDVGTQVFWDVT
jgi:hypothetical protein